MSALQDPSAFDIARSDPRLEPQFRVISIAGERKAFRLESVFWTVMGLVARRNRRSLAEEMAAALGRLGQRVNQSAHLRARYAADLLDLLEIAETNGARPDWAAVVDAMPQPAVVLTRTMKVLQLNAPMRALLNQRGLPLKASTQPVIDVPPAIAERLGVETGAVGGCNAIFRDGAGRCVVRTRFVSAAGGAGPLLLGFPDLEE
ncbi:hypothetical protein ACO2Q3_25515 [Caulobacter sp. KR2-114]|uniref:hypothetical protein n=1 Tax=Caulobacter sp. KR2-114 TaxID=3400912 RepID=UPI003C018F8C